MIDSQTIVPISVVMPVFNGGPHLKAAVESILGQSLTTFEFIIIDDGSIDGSGEMLEQVEDERIHLVRRENRGFAATLNEAIGMARGKYIARMDADDISLSDRLALQLAYMEAHPDVHILGGQARAIDENNRSIGCVLCPLGRENVRRTLSHICPMIHPSYFVRKTVYEASGGYRHMPPVEDYDFLLRASELGFAMDNLRETVLCYRQHLSGMTGANIQRAIGATAAVRRMHRLRLKGVSEAAALESLRRLQHRKPSRWFQAVYGFRSKLMARRGPCEGVSGGWNRIALVLVSILHWQIAIDSYHAMKAAPYRLQS